MDRGDWTEAEDMLRGALEVEEHIYGPVHVETAGTLLNLGACLGQQGKADEAGRMLRRAAQVYRSVLGVDHVNTRAAYGWLRYISSAERMQMS